MANETEYVMSDEDDYQYSEGSDEEDYAIASDDDNMEWNAVENPNAAPMSWNKNASSIGGKTIRIVGLFCLSLVCVAVCED